MKVEEYHQLFVRVFNNIKKSKISSEYGSKIMPILEVYKNITNYEDRIGFQKALEMLLRDQSEEIRSFGVTICLGFYVFKDAI